LQEWLILAKIGGLACGLSFMKWWLADEVGLVAKNWSVKHGRFVIIRVNYMILL